MVGYAGCKPGWESRVYVLVYLQRPGTDATRTVWSVLVLIARKSSPTVHGCTPHGGQIVDTTLNKWLPCFDNVAMFKQAYSLALVSASQTD